MPPAALPRAVSDARRARGQRDRAAVVDGAVAVVVEIVEAVLDCAAGLTSPSQRAERADAGLRARLADADVRRCPAGRRSNAGWSRRARSSARRRCRPRGPSSSRPDCSVEQVPPSVQLLTTTPPAKSSPPPVRVAGRLLHRLLRRRRRGATRGERCRNDEAVAPPTHDGQYTQVGDNSHQRGASDAGVSRHQS